MRPFAPRIDNLPALTALRFCAAIAVVLHHLHDFTPFAPSGAAIARGGLAVDFFFILSGFILTHVHGAQFRQSLSGSLGFLRARLARIYPAHLAMLAIFVLFVLVGKAAGSALNEERYGLGSLLYEVFLVDAWGFDKTLGWNYPAWSISAEWAAYLGFPFLAILLTKLRPRDALLALGAVALVFLACAPAWGWTQRTVDFGILRIIPEFAMGMLARLAFPPRPARAATPIFILIVVAIAAAIQFDVGDAPIVIGFVALVVAASRLDGWAGKALANPLALRLGEESYSLYLVHVFVFGLVFKASGLAARLGVDPHWLWLVAIAGALAGASVLYRLVEHPGRRLLTRGIARKPKLRFA